MSEILFEEVNPNGNIQALVEVEADVCFFYLHGAPETEFGVKTCWVRNLVPAPASLDRDGMCRGEPPLNPAAHCRHPEGLNPPNKDKLRVVWLPEGNGAALIEGDQVLAASYLSAQSNLPWSYYTWLGPFHTLPCDSWVNPEFEFAYLSYEHAKVPAIDLGQHLGDPVNILWLNPITELERQQAMGDSCENLANSLPAERWSMV
jgi:hypothetical protein